MIKIIVLLILFVNISYGYNVEEILSKIRWGLRDNIQDTIKLRWNDEILLNLVNEAQTQVCEISWSLHSSTRITTIAGTTSYTLPNDCYAISRVVMDMDTILPEKSISLLDQENAYWFKESTSEPKNYYMTWDRKIGFYYVPDTTYNMDIDYIQIATDLVNKSDIPFNNVTKLKPYHEFLVWYVIGYCSLVENKNIQAQIFWSLWSAGISRLPTQIGATPNYGQFFGGQRE